MVSQSTHNHIANNQTQIYFLTFCRFLLSSIVILILKTVPRLPKLPQAYSSMQIFHLAHFERDLLI